MEEIQQQIKDISDEIDIEIDKLMEATKKIEELKKHKHALERVMMVIEKPFDSIFS